MLQQQPPHRGVAYRPDIDGLRALAVLLVILYHLGTRVQGGYVGVDVFFVISGYLISSVLMADFAAGRFSIRNFYERRIRRIFPAMLAMMAVVTGLVLWYLTPQQVVAYAWSELAALASVSNFLFWSQSNYFDLPSSGKPLLHTWSLGVEEQFYIAFPILLALIHRYLVRRMREILLALTALSFAAAVWVTHRNPTAGFYASPLRAWELLAGTIVSQKYLPSIRGAWARNLAAAAGLAAVVYSGLFYTPFTPFPGASALLPVLGSALIIAAGETGSSVVGRVLGWPPFVFVGLISYSLYLWHWPMIVLFLGPVAHAAHPSLDKLLFLLAMIAIAALSWQFIEQPFRRKKIGATQRSLFLLSGESMGVLATLAVVLIVSAGLPQRFPAAAQPLIQIESRPKESVGDTWTCFLPPRSTPDQLPRQRCLPPPDGRPTLLLAGDSHAAAISWGFTKVFTDHQILQANYAGCPPLADTPNWLEPGCRALNDFLFHDYLLHHHVDTVLLQANWKAHDLPALGKTIAYCQEHQIPVVLMGPAVTYDKSLLSLLILATRDHTLDKIASHEAADIRQIDVSMRQLAASQWHVPYISIYDDLCTPDCPVFVAPGTPMTLDGSHLTPEGGMLLAERVRQAHQIL